MNAAVMDSTDRTPSQKLCAILHTHVEPAQSLDPELLSYSR